MTRQFLGAGLVRSRGTKLPFASRHRRGDHGWEGPKSLDGLDPPDEDDAFDYDAFVEEEFGAGGRRFSGRELFWWLVALATLIAFVWLAVGGTFF